MKKRLTVSVVIPAYNEAERITACLDALAAQTIPPDEVIVVDNNSTDRTAEIAIGYKFVKVITEKIQGRVFARDAGFSAARGDIIARADADSVVPANWVEHIQDFFFHDEQRAFTGSAAFSNVRFARAVTWLYNLMAFDFNRLLIGHPTLWGSNMALTKKQWADVKNHICQRNDIHEDLDLSIHLYQRGVPIVYDYALPVGAHLRRVHSNRHELWDYLNWWPRTLRVHGKKTWPLCWLFGVLMLYGLAMFLAAADFIARLFGLKPSD